MRSQRPYKRKALNLAVNRDMQLRMIAKIATILFVSLLISSSAYYGWANQEITSSFRLFHIKARNFLDFLLPAVAASFVLSLAVGTLASLFFPKNIAGSLFRIESEVRRIAAGDLGVRIKLRSGDEGTALAAALNGLTADLQTKAAAIADALAEADDILPPGVNRQPTLKETQRLQALHGRIAAALVDWKSSPVAASDAASPPTADRG